MPSDSPFDGELIRLRAREQADLSQLNALFDDPEVLAGLASVTFPQPLAGIREWFARTRQSEDQVTFVIETLDQRRAIGICGLEAIDRRARTAQFGIWIGKPDWGKGYGTDATRTICRFGFRQMNLHRITLHVIADNAKAITAYERAGFRREGTLREAHFVGGRRVDLQLMGMLADELKD